MNKFDFTIIHFFNQFAQRSWLADGLISNLSENQLLKGAFIMAIFWWAWYREAPAKTRDREFLLSGIIVSSAALLIARALALSLPFRERPLQDPALHFRVPFGVDQRTLLGWSCFPSDHAVLFFALATSICFLSRKLGIIAYCHAFFIVCLPLIYQGIHFPTDIVAGALLGIAIAHLSKIKGLRTVLTSLPMRSLERSPAIFYPFFYLLTFLVGTDFVPVRDIFVSAWNAVHRLR
jgi:undecaprenyl-diphosphatase